VHKCLEGCRKQKEDRSLITLAICEMNLVGSMKLRMLAWEGVLNETPRLVSIISNWSYFMKKLYLYPSSGLTAVAESRIIQEIHLFTHFIFSQGTIEF
jgi:hypothetical protein